MTTPHEEQPQTEVAATPSVTTAPPRARWRFATVPSRLGRARTSTVVLAVLFVAVFVLWVYVRPETVATPAGTTSGVTGPADPETTSEPAPTTSEPATTTDRTTTPPTDTTTESSTAPASTTGATSTTSGPSSPSSRSSSGAGTSSSTGTAPTS